MNFRFVVIFLLLFTTVESISQSKTLKGQLIIQNFDDYHSIFKNTKVILESGIGIDSVALDSDLRFSFNNISEGKYYVSVNPHSYPRNTRYIIKFKHSDKNKTIEIPYSLTCPYDKDNKICPICCKDDEVIPIVYGMIMRVTFKDKNGNITDKAGNIITKETKKTYREGGCVTTGCDPHWYCERDDNEF